MAIIEHQPQPRRAMDTAIASAEVTSSEAIDFVHACAVLEALITKESPDIILFPQRGAGPIRWTVNALMERSRSTLPQSVDLPIGTYRLETEREHTQDSGITSSQKRSIIHESFQDLYDSRMYVPGTSRVMLVDEVQSGGTLSKAATATRLAMDAMDDGRLLNIVAFQDSRHELVGGRNAKRAHVFESFSSNRRQGFKTNILPAELFTVDRPALLDEIIRDPEHESERLTDQFEIIPNESARDFFRALAHTYRNPDSALEEIEDLRQEKIAMGLGATILQEPILKYITDPRPVRTRSQRVADMSELLAWWTRFAKMAKDSR